MSKMILLTCWVLKGVYYNLNQEPQSLWVEDPYLIVAQPDMWLWHQIRFIVVPQTSIPRAHPSLTGRKSCCFHELLSPSIFGPSLIFCSCISVIPLVSWDYPNQVVCGANSFSQLCQQLWRPYAPLTTDVSQPVMLCMQPDGLLASRTLLPLVI